MFIIIAIVITFLWVLLLIAVYEKSTNAVCESKRRLDGKTAIVTGGTAGMGLEVAKDFAERGARVIIACPFQQEGLSAQKHLIQTTGNKNVVFKILDLGSLSSTREFASDILKTEQRLDILVNNAGLGAPSKLSGDGLSFVMQVNYYGPYLLTLLLLPLLKKSGKPQEPSRIVNVASVLHMFGDVDLDNLNYLYHWQLKVYANSKLCLVLFGLELSKRMAELNVIVNSVDPGAVGTNIYISWKYYIGHILKFSASLIFKTPKQGAQTTIYVSVDDRAGEVTGGYFKNCQLSRAVSKGRDDKMAKKLWEETRRLVNMSVEEQHQCFK